MKNMKHDNDNKVNVNRSLSVKCENKSKETSKVSLRGTVSVGTPPPVITLTRDTPAETHVVRPRPALPGRESSSWSLFSSPATTPWSTDI